MLSIVHFNTDHEILKWANQPFPAPRGETEQEAIFLCLVAYSQDSLPPHSALKLEKNAISTVQKHIICIFKNVQKSIFVLEISPKIAFLVILNFFLV